MQSKDEIEFIGRIKKSDGCWLWRGPKMKNGYGRFKNIYAHRLAYQLFNGDLKTGMLVCHRCDNRMCVRPDHLFLGTLLDNAKDMVNKGRAAKGEKHSQAVFTDLQAAAMQEIYKTGFFSQEKIAMIFKSNRSTVQKIVNGSGWKHLHAT